MISDEITQQHLDTWQGFRDLFFCRTDRIGRRLPDVLGDNGKAIVGPWRWKNQEYNRMDYQGLNANVIAQHLSGVLTDDFYERVQIQTYPVNLDGTSVFTTIDLDVKGEAHADVPEHFDSQKTALAAARKLIALAEALGLKAHLEITKSAGYRVWIFHERCSWMQAKDLGRLLLTRAGLNPKIEVFPSTAPAGKDNFGTAVLVPCWGGNKARGRQLMLDLDTEQPRSVGEFAADALAHRTSAGRLAEIVTAATQAGEIKETQARRERSERTEDTDNSFADASIAEQCWQAQLDGCEALREMAQRCEDGRELSRAEWMRLATHLKAFSDWGLAEFHRLSAFDPRYSEYETDAMLDSLNYGPTRCDKMECGRDPQDDCGMAEGKVSASWFAYRGLKQLKMVEDAQDQNVSINRELATFDQTDTGNAERLFARHGEFLRHSPKEKSWYTWQGDVWVRHSEDSPVVLQFSVNAMRKIKDEAEAIMPAIVPDVKEMKKPKADANEAEQQAYSAYLDYKAWENLTKHAKYSQAEPKIKAALSLLRTVSAVRVDAAHFDSDPELVSVINGTLNLRTGKLHEHAKDDMITQLMPVEFDARAKCPVFDKFITEVVPDPQTRWHLQKWFGYGLTALMREQIYLYLYGSGKNGKSTLLNIIKRVMGSELHATITSSAVMDDAHGNKDMQRAMLPFLGPRAITITEVSEGSRLDEELLKAATGGDPIKVRRLYQEEFEVVPTVKITMAGNHKPKITGTDMGIWRRVHLVPFETVIQEADTKLSDKLAEETSGILNWMLAGLAGYYNEGLVAPPQVVEATQSYRADSDVFGQFLDERFILDPKGKIEGGLFYQAYNSWCFENGYKAMASNTLANRMKDRGFAKGEGRERRTWIGLRLRNGSDDLDRKLDVVESAESSEIPAIMRDYEHQEARTNRQASDWFN